MPTESFMNGRDVALRGLAALGLLIVGIALITTAWAYSWALTTQERALVGRWVLAAYPESDVLALSDNRRWDHEDGIAAVRDRGNSISCHFGVRSGMWEVTGGLLIRHGGRQPDVQAVEVVGRDRIVLDHVPYNRVR